MNVFYHAKIDTLCKGGVNIICLKIYIYVCIAISVAIHFVFIFFYLKSQLVAIEFIIIILFSNL